MTGHVTRPPPKLRVDKFRQRFPEALPLVCHAALPVVLTPELVHYLRTNFFLDPPYSIPYRAEADLLLSPLCREIGDGLYELDPDVRALLLEELLHDPRFGPDRVRQVASLLWQYGKRSLPWTGRPGLERAQELTAVNFLDPVVARQWLSDAEHQVGEPPDALRPEWFIAMRRELQEVLPTIPAQGEPPVFHPLGSLRGHRDTITRFAWSPDGRWLASASYDHTVRIWDFQTGECRLVLAGHTHWVFGIAWSPDGRIVASASEDRSIRLWDATTGDQVAISHHEGAVYMVAFSHSGTILASCSVDETVRLWVLGSGRRQLQERAILRGHTRGVNCVAWYMDGRFERLCSASVDHSIRLWDIQSAWHGVLQGHTGDVMCVAWSPHHSLLASSASDGTIRIWDPEKQQLVRTLAQHKGLVSWVSFSADGRLLASKCGDEGVIRLWSCGTWKSVALLPEPSKYSWPRGLAFHPQDMKLATLGNEDMMIRLWRVDAESLGSASLLSSEGFDHILWVDDHPNNNALARRSFEAAGLNFTLALSTNEALTSLRNFHFAGIISDMKRREGQREGYLLLGTIRQQADQTPLCFYAGSDKPEHKAETKRQGGQECTNNTKELSQFVIESVFARYQASGKVLAEARPSDLDELKRFLNRVRHRSGRTLGMTLSPLLRIDSPIHINDPPLHFGPWVTTRELHMLGPTPPFRLGVYAVRNLDYEQFVKSGGYEDRTNWRPDAPIWEFRCQDGKTFGPSTWSSGGSPVTGTEFHPVSGVSFFEADAFCRWLNRLEPRSGWVWQLPAEDMWEYAARCRIGSTPTRYPWGDSFEAGRCNCALSQRTQTSDVGEFRLGNTPDGCADMAGNVWEFVEASDQRDKCVLRGGSFLNNDHEVRADLRLGGVRRNHRPVDFGFRCALVRVTAESTGVPLYVRRVWIFQVKPDVYDLRANRDREKLFWYARKRYSNDILRGDIGYLWQTGDNAGLYGWAVVSSDRPIAIGTDDHPDYRGRAEMRVDLHFRQQFEPPIPKSRVAQFEGLQNLSILKLRTGAIHDVKQELGRNEAEKLSKLVHEEGYIVPVPLALDVSSLTVLQYADELRVASAFKEVQIDQLLQALLANPEGRARRILLSAGIDDASLITMFPTLVGVPSPSFPLVALTHMPPLSVDTRRALLAAEDFATELHATTIRSEHVLKGVLEISDAEVVQKLRAYPITASVRQAIIAN